MTREEKVLIIKDKISKEIDTTVPQLIENLQWATNNRFVSTSFSIFYKSSMILASLAELKQKLTNKYHMFEQIKFDRFIVSEDTLDTLLEQSHILFPIGYIHFDYDDEYWEHEYISILKMCAHEKKNKSNK